MLTLSRREAIKAVIGAGLAASATASLPVPGEAQPPETGEKKPVTVTPVLTETLPELEGKELRMMTMDYAPSGSSFPRPLGGVGHRATHSLALVSPLYS